jgi:hypothetical protein
VLYLLEIKEKLYMKNCDLKIKSQTNKLSENMNIGKKEYHI